MHGKLKKGKKSEIYRIKQHNNSKLVMAMAVKQMGIFFTFRKRNA